MTKVPLLIFPECFMRLMGDIPQIARPLKVFDSDRVKKLLSLAQLLLETQPSEGTARSVQFLMRISEQNPHVEPVPPLRWLCLHTPTEFDALVTLDPQHLAPITRLIPQMRFSAHLRRR